MSQQQEKQGEANSRRECKQVAAYVLGSQLADKKQRHPGDAGRDGHKIARPKLLFVEDRLENQDINRRGVLQKDRVRCGREFRRQHEQEIGRDTSELQSPTNLVCRLLLEKKKKIKNRLEIYNKKRRASECETVRARL